MSELVEEDPETEHPPKHLSAPTFEAGLILGTIVLSNTEQIALMCKTLKEMPQFSVEGVGARIENTFVFEAPEEVNINIEVKELFSIGNKTVYKSKEKPEFQKEKEKERFIENINKVQPEGEEYTVESFEEENGEIETE